MTGGDLKRLDLERGFYRWRFFACREIAAHAFRRSGRRMRPKSGFDGMVI